MRLLAIDQGNTRTKVGMFLDGMPRECKTFDTEKTATTAELRAALFPSAYVPGDLHLGLCSVVPELESAWQQLARETGCTLTVLRGTSPTPLRNAYLTPETLGPDRLMAAVAAAHLAGMPVIPVSLGTATVVDAVADGAYLGGLIAPGIGVAARALSAAASGLWTTAWQVPDRAIGLTSETAQCHGLYYHSLGAVREMIRAVRADLGVEAPLVLTGGWAQVLAPHLDGVARIEPTLVLHGIAQTLAPRQAPDTKRG